MPARFTSVIAENGATLMIYPIHKSYSFIIFGITTITQVYHVGSIGKGHEVMRVSGWVSCARKTEVAIITWHSWWAFKLSIVSSSSTPEWACVVNTSDNKLPTLSLCFLWYSGVNQHLGLHTAQRSYITQILFDESTEKSIQKRHLSEWCNHTFARWTCIDWIS